MIFLFVFVLTVLIIDQGSKYYVVNNMNLEASIPVINNFFHFTYVENTGAAFGILPNQVIFFILVSIVAVVLLTLYYHQLPKNDYWQKSATCLIMGGALGNLIDRIRLGVVIDFLDFRIWPVFNLADTAISVGVGLLILIMFTTDDGKSEKIRGERN